MTIKEKKKKQGKKEAKRRKIGDPQSNPLLWIKFNILKIWYTFLSLL